MQETCVLNFLPVISKWKIYNLPSKKPVQYSVLLKQKRELQRLVEKTLNSKNLKTNSCTIVDRRIHLSNKNKIIEIVFLNQVVESYLLILKLSVHEKYALRRRNNLLVYLKNVGKDLRYELQNDSIYIKCGIEDQWYIFYNLYEFLLIRYGKSILGAAFYNSFVLKYMLINEKMALYIFTMDSKSIWETQFLEEEEFACNFSGVKSKNVLSRHSKTIAFHSDRKNYKTSYFDMSSEEVGCGSSNIGRKRRFSNDKNEGSVQKLGKSNRCFCKTKSCKCHYAKWKLFRNVSKYSVNNYMDILLTKGVLSDTELNSTPESFSVETNGFSLHNMSQNSPSHVVPEKHLLQQLDKKCVSNICNDRKFPNCQSDIQTSSKFFSEKNLYSNQVTTSKEEKSENNVQIQSTVSKNKIESINFQKQKSEMKDISLFNAFIGDEIDNGDDFDMFQTAAGKKINISQTALKAAEQMFAEVFQSDDISHALNESPKHEILGNKSSCKNIINASMSKASCVNEQLLGKGYMDESIDCALADKFFEEISFDEKETDSYPNLLSVQSPSMYTESSNLRMSSSGKIRKSLGGRRSLKPYSVPKM